MSLKSFFKKPLGSKKNVFRQIANVALAPVKLAVLPAASALGVKHLAQEANDGLIKSKDLQKAANVTRVALAAAATYGVGSYLLSPTAAATPSAATTSPWYTGLPEYAAGKPAASVAVKAAADTAAASTSGGGWLSKILQDVAGVVAVNAVSKPAAAPRANNPSDYVLAAQQPGLQDLAENIPASEYSSQEQGGPVPLVQQLSNSGLMWPVVVVLAVVGYFIYKKYRK